MKRVMDHGWTHVGRGLLLALMLTAFLAPLVVADEKNDAKSTSDCGKKSHCTIGVTGLPTGQCEFSLPGVDFGVVTQWLKAAPSCSDITTCSEGTTDSDTKGCCAWTFSLFGDDGDCCTKKDAGCCAQKQETVVQAEVLPCPPSETFEFIGAPSPDTQHCTQGICKIAVCPQGDCTESKGKIAQCAASECVAACEKGKCGIAGSKSKQTNASAPCEFTGKFPGFTMQKSKCGTAVCVQEAAQPDAGSDSKVQVKVIRLHAKAEGGCDKACAAACKKEGKCPVLNAVKAGAACGESCGCGDACACGKVAGATFTEGKIVCKLTQELLNARVEAAELKAKLQAHQALVEQKMAFQQQLLETIAERERLEARFELAQREFEFNLSLTAAQAENAALLRQLELVRDQQQLMQQLSELVSENQQLKERLAQTEADDDPSVAKKPAAGEIKR